MVCSCHSETARIESFFISPAWTYQAKGGRAYRISPLIGADGTVYLLGEDKLVTAVASDGTLKWEFATGSRILARPALGADGSLYVAAEDRSLHGLNPDGSQRFLFRPPSGKFKTSPVLSPDGATVYVASEDRLLYTVDTATGAERWRYTMAGPIKASPTVDPTGAVIIGSEGGDLVMLDPLGHVLDRKIMAGMVTQSATVSAAGDVTVRVGEDMLVTYGPLPKHWDGRPDVQATDSKKRWNLVNPVSLDMGVDTLHQTVLPDGQPVTGEGVTVAVVDSGLYFDQEVKGELGTQVQKLFLGQADFVDRTCARVVRNKNKTDTLGTQFDDYCFQTWEHSLDAHGHGIHVAGAIWNQFMDAQTGVTMGIAPGANVLSVRVLGADGTGSYATVIQGIQYVVEHKDQFNVRVMNVSLSATADLPYFVDPLNRAVEAAWAAGITVVAAAGNAGPVAESITVPGNDPYVITVGAVDERRTPGYWGDDRLPAFSATGPTQDGFVKPDVVAPGTQIVSFMYNACRAKDAGSDCQADSQMLVREHSDYSETASLFRMSGTSEATALVSGVVALMLQVHPDLTPDQVKYRLMHSAVLASADDAEAGGPTPVYNIFQQGQGRIWAPDAVFGDFPADARANDGLDILEDLAHNTYTDSVDNAYHYQGPVHRALSGDESTYLYYVTDADGAVVGMGAASAEDKTWRGPDQLGDAGSLFWDSDGGALSYTTGPGGFSWNGTIDPDASAVSTTRWVDDE